MKFSELKIPAKAINRTGIIKGKIKIEIIGDFEDKVKLEQNPQIKFIANDEKNII